MWRVRIGECLKISLTETEELGRWKIAKGFESYSVDLGHNAYGTQVDGKSKE